MGATAQTIQVVGRDAELAEVRGFLETLDALPGVCLLEGEAGIGKTTLWLAGVAAARELSYRVLTARPASAETQLPFTGLGDLLTGCVEEILEQLPPPQRRALGAALLLAEPDGPPPQPQNIAVATLSCLRALARESPVLIGIDDVQWLDPSSAAALEFAIRRLGESDGVAVLLSRRTEDTERPPLGIDSLLEVRVRRLGVGPLSLGALHRVLTARLGHSLPRPLLLRIHDVSGGNPFFALELAQVVERRGALAAGAELPLPASLAEALRERLDAVPADTRETLLAVASLTTPTLTLLEAALGPDARSRVQPAIDAHLLVLEDERIRFAHPLIGSAVYAEAWPTRRREGHKRLAEVVTDSVERARHLALAIEGPDAEVAGVLEEAAHGARLRGAPEEAAALAEQSWQATPTADAETRWRRGFQAAEYHAQSGDLERGRVLAEQLLPTARPGDERSQVLALLSMFAQRVEGYEAALALIDRALAEAASTHQRQSVESDYVALATVAGDVDAGASHAREALRLADELGDPATVADALSSFARTEQLLGRGLRRDLLEQADALAELRGTDGLKESVVISRNATTWASVLATADEFDDARGRLEASQRLIEKDGLAHHLPEVLRVRADLECWAGDWELAARCAEVCDEAAEQSGQPSKHESILYATSFVAAHLGRVDEARALTREGLAVAERTGNDRTLLRHLAVAGFLELSLDDAAAAHEPLERAAAAAAKGGFVEPNWIRFHGDLAESLLGLGELDQAEALVDWLEERGRTSGYPWTVATAARCRGVLLASRGQLDGAAAAFENALAANARLRNPFEQARTMLALGRTQRRAKQRREARETLGAALASFDELGARLWAELARDELKRVGGRAPAGGLTETERRVAELVAEGRSNKEVAAALYVTVKSVEANLSRVYAKLGLRSRTELAARLKL